MTIDTIKEEARRHEQREEWIKALDLYLQAIARQSDEDEPDIALYNRVGDLQVRLGDVQGAVENYETAIQLYRDVDLPNNAIAVCRKIIRHDPQRPSPFLRMGQIRAGQGFIVDARQNFLTYAEMEQANGNTDEAFRALEEFVGLAPTDTETRIFLAEQLVARDRADDAVRLLERAYRVLARGGETEAADAVLERIQTIDPERSPPEVEALEPESPPAALAGLADEGGPGELAGFETTSLGGELSSRVEDRVEAEESVEAEADQAPVEGLEPADSAEEEDRSTVHGLEGIEHHPGSTGPDAEPTEEPLEAEEAEPAWLEASRKFEGTEARESGDDYAFSLESDEDRKEDQESVPELDLEQDREEEVAGFDLDPDEALADEEDDDGGAPLPLLGEDEEAESIVGEGPGEPLELSEIEHQRETESETEPAPEHHRETESAPEPETEPPPDSVPEIEPTVARQAFQDSVEEAAASDTDADGEGEGESGWELDDLALVEDENVGPETGAELDPLADLRNRVGNDPHDAEGWRRLGEALYEQGEDEEGRSSLERAHLAYAEQGDPEKAMRVVREILLREPDRLDLRQRVVEYAHRTNERTLLIQAFLELADGLRAAEEGQKAGAVYHQVLTLDPSNLRAREALGRGGATGRDRASKRDYVDLGSMVLDAEGERSTRWVVPAELPSGDEEADFSRMLSQFKEKVAENIASDDVKAHYDLGTAFKEMGLLEEAIGQFQQALRAEPRSLATFEMLGQCFLEKGESEVAIRTLERGTALQTPVEDDLLGIYYFLGQAHEKVGNTAAAREFYEKVFSLDINFKDVTERLRTLR